MMLSEKETIEINHWKHSMYESPAAFSLQTMLYKLAEGRVFWTKIKRYEDVIASSQTIVEIGAGQGWASCLLKHLHPHKQLVASDISPHAIEVMNRWEQFLHISLDKKIVCRSYDIPLENESVDLVFCYSSAHHFVQHEQALREAYRILKPGGSVLYLHEPSCKKWIYRVAHWRVNKKRPAVPEDVLVCDDMVVFAKNAGFSDARYIYDPTEVNRGPIEAVYYVLLQRVPILQRVFPCTADYWFKK